MEIISRKLRKESLYLSYKCQDGNLQSVFSCLEIVWTLYDRIMNWNPAIAESEDRDFFIISKGQATLALYPVLIEKGMFCMEEVASKIGLFHSRYCIQTDITKFRGGIENNAGSLGHGLPFAAGIAHGSRIKGLPSQVYVLCGDGEFCEGTMWETCLFASARSLDNLCIVVDDNSSAGVMVPIEDLGSKLSEFGFDVYRTDGHDMKELEKVFLMARREKNGKPKAVIAHTVRGYGSRTMMENDIWFHRAPTKEELEQLSEEVDAF